MDRYGEEKLWRLIALQGRSPFIMLGINVQFWRAYDKSLSTLLDEFAEDAKTRYPVRTRPPSQHTLFQAGFSARYARAADGTQALIDMDHDQPTTLRILNPQGQVQARRSLTDLLPPRRLNLADPRFVSGLSFTADGRTLYFVANDWGDTYRRARLLRYDLPAQELTVVVRDLAGMGGSVSPDGRRYVFVRPDGDRVDLAEVDIQSGAVRVLAAMAPGAHLVTPRFSPDGTVLVASLIEDGRYRLALFDAKSGRRQRMLSTGKGPVIDASFVDGNRVVYLGTRNDAGATPGFEVVVHDLSTDKARVVTAVPYLAFEPQAMGGNTVRFLNREGWAWTIDEVALPAPDAPVAGATPAAAEPAGDANPATTSDDAADVAAIPAVPVPPPLVSPPSLLPPLESPVVLAERPYVGSWNSVPWPRLIAPDFTAITSVHRIFAVEVLAADRLNYHLWNAAVSYQPGSRLASFAVVYRNRLLAPVMLELSASQNQLREWAPAPLPGGPPPLVPEVFERTRHASASVTRSLYLNPVSLGVQLVESYRPDNADAPLPLTRVAGPFVSASYVANETTKYTGAYRELAASLRVAAYPRALSANELAFVDVNARLSGIVPLPLLRRHSLLLSGVVRTLPGAPADQPLLRIGGLRTKWVTRRPDQPVPELPDPAQLPADALLIESLHGFEDYPLAGNTVVSAEAAYRYPLIIDWGSASTFGVLPAFFLQQVNLNLFGVIASTRTGGVDSRHEAVGGSLGVRAALWLGLADIRYQVTRRLSDDHAWAGFVVAELHPELK